MFGIDHELLTKAGEEIRTGQGQLGELLFAAASGFGSLSQAQQWLQKELDRTFQAEGPESANQQGPGRSSHDPGGAEAAPDCQAKSGKSTSVPTARSQKPLNRSGSKFAPPVVTREY